MSAIDWTVFFFALAVGITVGRMVRSKPETDERFEFLKQHCSSCIFLGNEDTDRGAWADKIVRDGNELWIALGRELERTELVRDARREHDKKVRSYG